MKHLTNYKLFETNEDSSILLLVAVAKGTYEKIKELLDSGANVDAQNTHGNTPLIIAIEYNRFDVIKLLLKYGADVNIKNIVGNISLTSAFLYYNGVNKKELINLLIKHGADVNNQDNIGNTLLHNAAWKSEFDIIEILLDNNADATIKNSRNEYFIQMAEMSTLKWIKRTISLQRFLLDKFPVLYPVMYRMNALDDSIEEEYKYLKSASDLNLL